MSDKFCLITDTQGSAVNIYEIAGWSPSHYQITWHNDEWRPERNRNPENAEVGTHTEVILRSGERLIIALNPAVLLQKMSLALGA